MADANPDPPPGPGPEDRRADRVEWIVGLLSAVVVALMLGFLIFHGARGTEALPELDVTRLPAEPRAEQHLRFAVVNRGARTASNVTIALTLGDAAGRLERRTLTIEFVPAESEVTGAFLLDGPAQTLAYPLEVESYLDP